MADNNIFADVEKEGQDPFTSTKETETPSESQPETKEEEVAPDQGDKPEAQPDNTDPYANKPFHEHPRWKEREEKLRELEAFREQATGELEELRQLKSQLHPSDTSIPQWFVNMYGEDPETWQRYQEHEKTLKEQVKRELIEEQVKAQEAQQAEEAHWTKWVNEQVESLVTEVNFDLKDKDALLNVMLKYRPTDDNGNLDFRTGYDLLTKFSRSPQATEEKEKVEAKKKLASLTTAKSGGDGTKKDYVTNNDLRNKGWTSLT